MCLAYERSASRNAKLLETEHEWLLNLDFKQSC
jgi:hypothetical protein